MQNTLKSACPLLQLHILGTLKSKFQYWRLSMGKAATPSLKAYAKEADTFKKQVYIIIL